ncbi:uncharacterized protein Z520_08920 [Fonsecaea multimorphosa CBS 102226]|uniref:Nitrogen permease regulator 3 n=1 Tax=Fonsecaea multimorphosa CBS 102226 TaxID=1442371 RepID=A0A0D2KFG9_9EURO|nr:uncharacterized protein Z520_08920 [Fonsecaea multimorphosa CBS 102226]KIX95403.1 hypothetical protein Z520_08920 [Fonsecaea multimorphosa CBS 102226]OAL21070.1 hypothetical protein AYO22_08354 [Fonsecaea multimorphosa]
MSTSATSLNPSLLAILLVVQGRTGSGAEIVFHYPPDPLSAERPSYAAESTDDDDGESSSSDSEESSSEEDFDLFTRRFGNAVTATQNQENQSQHSDDEDSNYLSKRGTQDNSQWKPSWEPLLGLGEDGLVSLLAPGRSWHKRRFELGINDLTFLGRPVYAREDGFWRKVKVRRSRTVEDEGLSPEVTLSDSAQDDEVNDDEAAPTDHSSKKDGHAKERVKSQLTMFHVVFVMDPPPLEHTARVKEMYDHVVKKFSKVLKWAQSHHDYVWEQSELLQSIRSAHFHQRSSTKVLYTEMKQRSPLAAAIAKVFDNISASKIAAITLSPKLSVSLQIPPVTSTSYLPSLSEPPLQPGLWLTTATDPTSTASDLDATSSTGPLQLSKNFTLLLKSSPQKILKDIQAAGGSLAMPLTNFIGHLKPTKSFYKISLASQIALGDIQHLARHLVYWRRAIAIPPLHQRDTYIVSPNANMSRLVSACKTYEATFPMMPSLPKMLNALSGTPAPYGTLIPSRDHKEEYYRVLAWLMRDGWVTQLRTFAFVRVDPEVKKAVREKEREESKGSSRTPGLEREASASDRDRDTGTGRSFGSGGTPNTTPAGGGAISSFKQRPSMPRRPSSDGRQSISTDRTSVRGGGQQFKHNPKAASLIISPQRASPEESRWLDYITSTISSSPSRSSSSRADSPASSDSEAEAETAELLRRYWPVFVKYFSGSEPLERIPVREGLKRKLVWDVLEKVGADFEGGVEDEKGENKRVLVTIRHW